MKLLIESWRSFIQEAKDYLCPAPTQDLELNTKNRNAAIKAEHIQYGPLNLEDEQYWDRAAAHWKTEPEVAKKMGNLVTAGCIILNVTRQERALLGLRADQLVKMKPLTSGKTKARNEQLRRKMEKLLKRRLSRWL